MQRWSARHLLPAWLADAVDAAAGSLRSGGAYLVTLFYTICYARHFYCRLGPLLQGSALRARAFPYLLRPFPYFAAFLGLMNVFKYLGVPWLGELPAWSSLHYNIVLLLATLMLPLGAVLAIVALLAMAWALRLFAGTISSLAGRRERPIKKAPINWAFFALLRRPRFWRGYRYRELFPAMLYCSINGIILWPLAFYIFLQIAAGTDKVLNSSLLWDATHSDFGPMWGTIAAFVLSAAGLLVLYGLVLRPVLYAFVFRSQLPLLRRGLYPELLAFAPHIDAVDGLVFLDADLEETTREQARFVWVRKRYGRTRLLNRLMAAPK